LNREKLIGNDLRLVLGDRAVQIAQIVGEFALGSFDVKMGKGKINQIRRGF